MAKVDPLVKAFLAQKFIAVAGVSDRRDSGCNTGYHRFKEAGYVVYPVNPRIAEFEGETCYPNLKSIPNRPDAVFIMTNPKVTEQIVEECVELGIKHVWMHCMLGTKPGSGSDSTSVSQDAVRLCRENGIEVIPGSCPNQFLNPDFGHAMMRRLFRLFGNLNVSENGGGVTQSAA
jgi:predicted CoA-binding protein